MPSRHVTVDIPNTTQQLVAGGGEEEERTKARKKEEEEEEEKKKERKASCLCYKSNHAPLISSTVPFQQYSSPSKHFIDPHNKQLTSPSHNFKFDVYQTIKRNLG
jgi:hypothetical protein